MPEPIRIEPPSPRAEGLSERLLKGAFDEKTEVQLADYKKKISFGSGPDGGAGVQALEWLIIVTRNGLWEYLSAFLAGYAGKEFLKGYASDAGKDFWKGTKILVASIARHTGLSPSEKASVKIDKDTTDDQGSLSLTLAPSWFVDQDYRHLVVDLESRILPAVAEYIDHHGADPDEQHYFSIKPIENEPCGWQLVVTLRANPWEVTIKLLQDKVVWDTRNGESDARTERLLVLLMSKGGVSAITQTDLYNH